MQQTQKYKLNLIETSDAFSPAPLNENAQKTEAALAEAAVRLTAAETALDSRVTALELKKIAIGSYTGNGLDVQFLNLGFTPKAVYVHNAGLNGYDALFVGDGIVGGSSPVGRIVEGGFELLKTLTLLPNEVVRHYLNESNLPYYYIAFA